MNGPRDDYTKWSKSDRKEISDDIAYIWDLKKWYKWFYLQSTVRLTDIQDKLMVTKGEGGINWEFGIILVDINYYTRNGLPLWFRQ